MGDRQIVVQKRLRVRVIQSDFVEPGRNVLLRGTSRKNYRYGPSTADAKASIS